MRQKNAAFITFDTIGDGTVPDGWHNVDGPHAAFVMQLADRNPTSPEQEEVYALLTRMAQDLDYFVVYCSSPSNGRSLSIAASLPGKKIIIVNCACEIEKKIALYEGARLQKTYCRLVSMCHGQMEMKFLLDRFVETGSLEFKKYRWYRDDSSLLRGDVHDMCGCNAHVFSMESLMRQSG